MKVPISWLEEYVPVTVPLDDLAHRLTMAGTEVESIDTTLSFDGVVVGLAKEVGPHPNAAEKPAAFAPRQASGQALSRPLRTGEGLQAI